VARGAEWTWQELPGYGLFQCSVHLGRVRVGPGDSRRASATVVRGCVHRLVIALSELWRAAIGPWHMGGLGRPPYLDGLGGLASAVAAREQS